MMRTLACLSLALAAAFAADTGSASAQSVPERTGANSVLGVSPSTQDFVTIAANSDMMEIESSKLAAQKATSEKSKTFAAKMIKDHTETSTELKGLVSSGKVKVTLPAAMDEKHKAKVDKLAGLSGDAFTREYNDLQVAAHKDAVSLFERYSKSGDNADLKAFAAKHLPHLQMHLQMAEDLKK